MKEYLQIDYNTSKELFKKLLENSETFKDYNYEGSNISMLIELLSFINDHSTYFSNKIVKNIFPESAEVYETMHSISTIRGYAPKGFIAPHLNLYVSVMVDPNEEFLPSPGDELNIPAWFSFDTGQETEDGEQIKYLTTETHAITIPPDLNTFLYTFNIPVREGEYRVFEYMGDDIVNKKLFLPSSNIDYDIIPYNENPSISLFVNGNPFTRVESFQKDIDTMTYEDDVFVLEYDKYQRYNIVFDKNISANDRIKIITNTTKGPLGNVSSNVIHIEELESISTVPYLDGTGEISYDDVNFLYNITKDRPVNGTYIMLWNPYASFKSALPENIQEVRENSKSLFISQMRNINSLDYQRHLKEHPDILRGNAWGEQEENPGNTYEYNKVYISVIPVFWEENEDSWYINGVHIDWERPEIDSSDSIFVPQTYNEEFKSLILNHLAPRKYIGSLNEIFTVPELVYFAFDIGIKTKKSYNFVKVVEELKEKLQTYFSNENRNFNEVIDFKLIHNYIFDMSVREKDKSFPLIRGINNLVFRDVLTYTPSLSASDPETIYSLNETNDYPMYNVDDYTVDYGNTLKPIKLGFNQFPVLSINNSSFINES